MPRSQHTPKPDTALDRRRARIVQAACGVFLDHSYDGASMDMIAAAADVTKKTVYNHFDNKEALFEAVLESFCDEISDSLDAPSDSPRDIEEGLLRFCRTLVATMAVAPGLEVYRLAITMSKRFPHFGQSLYMVGTARVVSALAEYLEANSADAGLAVAEPLQTARQLIGTVSFLIQTALLGAEIRPGSDETEKYIRDAVLTVLASQQDRRRR